MTIRLRVTHKPDGIRNRIEWEGRDHEEARRQLKIAKAKYDYAYLMMEDDDVR